MEVNTFRNAHPIILHATNGYKRRRKITFNLLILKGTKLTGYDRDRQQLCSATTASGNDCDRLRL